MREKIVVIDDDEKITSMLRRTLAFEGYEVIEFNNGLDGLKFMRNEEPDLVILDVMMPQIDGWEICRRLREAGSALPILMLTAKDEIDSRVKGLDLGADDYLVKPFALEELLARVRALLRRKSDRLASDANRQLRFQNIMLDLDTRVVVRNDQMIDLTTKEFELLKLFLEHPNHVLTRDFIMEKIWGIDYSGESNVLEVYIAMLRQKTEEVDGNRIIQTVRGAGYVLRGVR